MTNTYNTLNPLGSTSAKDLSDNTSNFDEGMNSLSPSFYDRFMRRRETWAGMQKLVTDFLEAMGFEATHLVYVDGTPLTVLRPTQLIDRAGSVYKVKQPASFPVNLTGTWATDQLLLVDVGDASLRAALASSSGASMIGFLQNSPLATAITAQAKMRQMLSVFDGFGVVGDGVADDTAALNKAFEAAYLLKKPLCWESGSFKVSEASVGAGYCLLNKGVSIYGDGSLRTVIVPAAGLSTAVTFMKIQPQSGAVLDFVELKDFMIYPGEAPNKYGGKAILVDMTLAGNATAFKMSGLYLSRGNDYSLTWITDATNNPQGGPANSVFERCSFWEGVNLINHGDSISFRNNVFRSTPGSGRVGLQAEGINASGGQPAQLNVTENNFDCDGGAFVAKNGLSGKFTNNNCEQTHGTGSASSAVIDIEGTASTSGWFEVSGNNVGIFGTAVVGHAIRVNNAAGAKVRDNRLLSAGPSFATNGILITPSATDTEVSGNEISTGFSVTILDSGVGSRGVPKFVTPLNGFGNLAGDQPLIVGKDPHGALWVAGSITCPVSASGQLFGSLPAGYRYAYRQRVSVSVIDGGNYVSGVVTIDTNGDMIFYSSAVSPSQFFLNVKFGGVGFVVGDL